MSFDCISGVEKALKTVYEAHQKERVRVLLLSVLELAGGLTALDNVLREGIKVRADIKET